MLDLSLLHGTTLVITPPRQQIDLPGVTVGFGASHRVTIEVENDVVTAVFDAPQPTLSRSFNSVFADWLLHNFTTVLLGKIRLSKGCTEVYDSTGKLRGTLR